MRYLICFILLLWAFAGVALEGFCPECLEGSKTVQEVENLKKIACEKIKKSSKCQKVPEEDLKVCGGLPNWVKVPFYGLGTVSSAMISGAAMAAGSGGYGLLFLPVALFAGYRTTESLDELGQELYAAREFEKIYKNVPGPDREQKAAAHIACKTGELLYNALYDDYNCLNDRARSVRACGAAAGTIGFLSGGERMDLPPRAREKDMRAFYKVRHETMKKLSSVEGFASSNADEPSPEQMAIIQRLKAYRDAAQRKSGTP